MKLYKLYTVLIVVALLSTSCSLFYAGIRSNTDKNVSAENKHLKFTYSYFEGMRNKMLGNYNEAADYFKKSIQFNKKSAAARYELANIYIIKGDVSTALSLMEEAVKINSDNMWYQITLAALYENRNQLQKAVQIYKDLTNKNPDNLELLMNYADLLKIAGKYKDAIDVLDKVELIIGVNEDISLNKQKLYFFLNEKEKGYEELKKLIEHFPLNVKYYGLLAELYVANNRYEDAKETYNKLLEIGPNSGLGHLSISEFYRITGDSTNSFQELKLAFNSEDVNVDIKIKLLLNYYFEPDNHKAYELLDILEKTHPEEAKAYTVYGDFLYNDKRYEEARDKYLKATEITKDNYTLWKQLLHVESLLNYTKSMYKSSKEALEYFPNQPALYLYFGASAIKQKKYKEAIDKLNTGMGLVSDKKVLFQFYSNLAEAYNHIKDYKKSDEFFNKALKIDSDDIYLLNNYSYYLSLRNENLAAAEAYAKKCIDKEPENSTFLDTYAWALYKQNKFPEALKIIEKAIEIGGNKNALIVEHYGDILYKSGQQEKAWEEWKNAVKIGKGSDLLKIKAESGEFKE